MYVYLIINIFDIVPSRFKVNDNVRYVGVSATNVFYSNQLTSSTTTNISKYDVMI